MARKSRRKELLTLGWREWVDLPDLGLERIKAKVDTGARTSALHAFEVRQFDEDGRRRVEFKMHPRQRDDKTVVVCRADVIDERVVRDSGGHTEKRWVIETPVTIGDETWSIEMTRTAIRHRAVVDPSRSYLVGRKPEES